MSVLEIARLTTTDGQQRSFEEAFDSAIELVKSAEGHLTSRLTRDIAESGSYVFLVEWNTLDDHTERFAMSPEFGEFQRIIGPFLAGEPDVVHVVEL